MENHSRICLIPRLSGIGGMVSFQGKLAAGLKARNVDVCFDLLDTPYDAILVIGGTRQIQRLWGAKRRGVRIVQRLDGMNWIHRIMKTGWRHWLRAEYGNINLALIRSSLADKIIYQSRFSRQWWEREKGETPCPHDVIYNGVDLSEFSPGDTTVHPQRIIRLLMVEGSLLGGYEFGLENAVKLAVDLAHSRRQEYQIELRVVGRVSKESKDHWNSWIIRNQVNASISIDWSGVIPHHQIVDFYRNAHLLYSADINAACPNSVLEAMSCGTPVISFDTGALPELIADGGGIVVPYGGNPWELDPPDIQSLSKGASDILENLFRFKESTRNRAADGFDVEKMVDLYLEMLLG